MSRNRRLGVAAVAATLVLSACGGGGRGDAAEQEGGPTRVTVSVVPAIDSASMYVGHKQGFFEDEGIELEFIDAGSGPAAVSSVVSGAANFGLAVSVAIVQARTNDIPIMAAAPAAGTGDDPAESKDQLVVRGDSDIQNFADLEGKTVAVVAVKNSPELLVSHLIDNEGADSTATQFVEVPFPEMGAALSSGRVDAIAIAEPFLARARQGGGRAIGAYTDEVLGRNTAYSYWFTSEEYAEAEPETVESFIRAMAKSGQYADEHPEEVRAVAVERLGIEEAVAQDLKLPPFGHEVNEESIDAIADLMVQYGYIESKPDMEGLVFGP